MRQTILTKCDKLVFIHTFKSFFECHESTRRLSPMAIGASNDSSLKHGLVTIQNMFPLNIISPIVSPSAFTLSMVTESLTSTSSMARWRSPCRAFNIDHSSRGKASHSGFHTQIWGGAGAPPVKTSTVCCSSLRSQTEELTIMFMTVGTAPIQTCLSTPKAEQWLRSLSKPHGDCRQQLWGGQLFPRCSLWRLDPTRYAALESQTDLFRESHQPLEHRNEARRFVEGCMKSLWQILKHYSLGSHIMRQMISTKFDNLITINNTIKSFLKCHESTRRLAPNLIRARHHSSLEHCFMAIQHILNLNCTHILPS
ncbi:hypothetical protein F8388_007706 [Cannabis sativa]|uniref:Uncharacterized protein n=1 Tax=Cannabis sativa TaxID=3483 RepID=A0A7J6FVM8_CANSA|nr:hypothetical protein F8388_007706 [Cannabis sativa]